MLANMARGKKLAVRKQSSGYTFIKNLKATASLDYPLLTVCLVRLFELLFF